MKPKCEVQKKNQIDLIKLQHLRVCSKSNSCLPCPQWLHFFGPKSWSGQSWLGPKGRTRKWEGGEGPWPKSGYNIIYHKNWIVLKPILAFQRIYSLEALNEEVICGVSSGFCATFFLANRYHHNWRPIHNDFMLRVTMEPVLQDHIQLGLGSLPLFGQKVQRRRQF